METRQIEFRFKGRRDYIQGPDMFNALTDAAGKDGLRSIRFTAHGFVRTPVCNLYLSDDPNGLADVADIRARCQFEKDGKMRWLALTEGAGDAASGGRYDYDEERLVAASRMEGESIALIQPSPFSFIESIVAMCKHMHQQMFPDVQGKWIFTRIDLDEVCEVQEKLSLRFRHNMNYRLTKSDILFDGQKIGDLYFSLVKA